MIEKPQLFIDFYGTLSHDKYWKSMDETAPGIQKFLFEHHSPLVSDWMLGKYTSEYINQFIAIKLNVDPAVLWNVFVDDCRTMNLVEGALENIAVLRNSYECVLLTDNMDCFQRFTVPALNLSNSFDRIISSSETRAFKTSTLPALVRPGAILIDDSVPACRVIDSLGGTGLLVTEMEDINHHLESLQRHCDL